MPPWLQQPRFQASIKKQLCYPFPKFPSHPPRTLAPLLPCPSSAFLTLGSVSPSLLYCVLDHESFWLPSTDTSGVPLLPAQILFITFQPLLWYHLLSSPLADPLSLACRDPSLLLLGTLPYSFFLISDGFGYGDFDTWLEICVRSGD